MAFGDRAGVLRSLRERLIVSGSLPCANDAFAALAQDFLRQCKGDSGKRILTPRAKHPLALMTGAEVLRHAIGLDGSPLSGGVTVDGSGWAADLLTKAGSISAESVTTPEGFVGELRGYQGEALAWLAFLDSVELGGCLALDMGLGKTPTVLAHLLDRRGEGPVLVVAPPAIGDTSRTPIAGVTEDGAARRSAAWRRGRSRRSSGAPSPGWRGVVIRRGPRRWCGRGRARGRRPGRRWRPCARSPAARAAPRRRAP